ncbi:MAG: hypothetical protein F4Y27_02810 [Acidimicrobiaceae bacterium]|nr:hypothetical protein [Acidimicrobiaceae bacterium]MYG54526.1 hypothetical protein [Acidimicrobiaceae bacterium]MYJ99469.1 hypothetical protein [Acidimicrobiaceae bacterium]
MTASDLARRDIGNVLTFTRDALTSGTQHTLFVRARDNSRTGLYGNSTCTTAPASTPAKATGFKCVTAEHNQIKLTWDKVIGADKYTVHTKNADSEGAWPTTGWTQQYSGPDNSVSVNLHKDQTYVLSVVAHNDNRRGNPTEITCNTISDDWLDITCTVTGLVTAQWTDPTLPATPAPTGYRVTITGNNSGVVRDGTVTGFQTTRFMGLSYPNNFKPKERYTVRVSSLPTGAGLSYVQQQSASCFSPLVGTPGEPQPDFPTRHDVSIIPQPANHVTNSCWGQTVTDPDGNEDDYTEYVCRFLKHKINYITKTSDQILVTGNPDPTHGVSLGLRNNGFYEGCKTYSPTTWKCSYHATRHWYQKTTNATFQQYLLHALNSMNLPETVKCIWAVLSFVKSGGTDTVGIIDDCGAMLAR